MPKLTVNVTKQQQSALTALLKKGAFTDIDALFQHLIFNLLSEEDLYGLEPKKETAYIA